MRELAEALKQRGGLRMRQGVVTAVDGSTNSVLIGGSTVAVDGVQHLNSCQPAVDDVVWITSDGADLWIIGTHGDPLPIDTDRLDTDEIQGVVVTSDAINALTIDAVEITGGTVTGTTLQTATSGPRVKISTDQVNRVQLFSGVSGEVLPGLLGGASDGVGGSFVELASADFGGGSAILNLVANPSTGTKASIIANSAALIVGSSSYTVKVDGHLGVVGRVYPSTDYVNGTSLDGIWIQDKYSVGKRWKISYDSSTGKLQVRFDASTYANFTKD